MGDHVRPSVLPKYLFQQLLYMCHPVQVRVKASMLRRYHLHGRVLIHFCLLRQLFSLYQDKLRRSN